MINPLCPSPPALGIPAYANRNRILEKLVASFHRLFTTSSDVLCSKFGGVWETLWVFKAARCTHDRCMKINKSPTVSYGVGTSFFKIWTANLAQLLTLGTLTNSQSLSLEIQTGYFAVGYPVGLLKLDIQMWTFQIWEKKNYAFIFEWTKPKPVGYTRTTYSQTGENTKWAEIFIWCLLLIFEIVYWDHLTQLLPLHGIAYRKASGWSGAKWDTQTHKRLKRMLIFD